MLFHSMLLCFPIFYIALLLPVPAIIIILTNKDYEIGFFTLPTAFCHTKNEDVAYYSLIFIISIIFFIGMPMLSYLLWTLHKVQYMNTKICVENMVSFLTLKLFTINIEFFANLFWIYLFTESPYYTPT